MYSKEPIWLFPENLTRKYEQFCFINNISERRIVRLFDAFLLRGRDNRNSRRIEILEESFNDLQNHIHYNFLIRSGNHTAIKIPEYLRYKFQNQSTDPLTWYTPTEVIKENFSILRNETYFTCEFIGELVLMGLIIGKYSPKENCYYILLNSFADLIDFRDHCVRQYVLRPPPDDRPAA